MREYIKKPGDQSRTLNSIPKASAQAPVGKILQAYENGTLGKLSVQRKSVEDEDLLQKTENKEVIQKSTRGAATGALLGGITGHLMTRTTPLRKAYAAGELNTLINNSEGQPNMVGAGQGHARQRHVEANAQIYVNRFPNRHPEQTKTAYLNNADQNTSATDAINSPPGQAALQALDTNPAIVRQAVNVASSVNNVVRVKGPNAAGGARARAPIVMPNVMFIFERTPAHNLHIVTCYPRN